MQTTEVEIVQLLTALSASDRPTRVSAEEALSTNRTRNGFSARLAAFATVGPQGPDAFPLRQMALTVSKRIIIEAWVHLAMDDRGALKQAFLTAIAEQVSGLRSLVHACVANIRSHGVWIELQGQLLAGISQGTPHEAACCVECVSVLLEDCGIDVAADVGPLQEPMLKLAASDATAPKLRRECVNAHASGVAAVLRDRETSEVAVNSVIANLPAWTAVHASLCIGLDSWDERDRVACAFTSVRTATTFARFRPLQSALAEPLQTVLRHACLLVQHIDGGYEKSVINFDDGGASEEEGGAAPLVAQLMELVQAMLGTAKLRAPLKGHVRSMLLLLLPFMRITEAQASSWRADPNEFLSHEEDEYARGCIVRLSGEGLIGELLEHMKRETHKALVGIVGELLERGEAGRAAGDVMAWKLSEVGLLLFGDIASEAQTRTLRTGELAPLAPKALNIAGRLCADTSAPEFLRARAFAVLRKSGDAVCALVPNDLPALLQASAAGLGTNEPLVVRVSALRAFCRFLTAVDDNSLRERLLVDHGVLVSLGTLLQDASDELLHLTLESLTLIIRQCPSAIVPVEASLAPLILEIWNRAASDPLVHLEVLDLVSCASASDPRLQKSMEERLTPAVVCSLQEGAEPMATAAAIELYGVLLKRTCVPISATLWACVEPLTKVVLRSADSGLLQNACEVLCTLVRRAPEQLSQAGMLAPMLQCVERLLGPDLDDEGCIYVAPFATVLLSQFGSMLSSDLVTGLLRTLATRLARAERPYLQQEIIVLFARLLLEDLSGVITMLAGLQVPVENGGPRVGLVLLLQVWLANAKEIRARRARNVTVTALCRLHERCISDELLRALQIGEAGEMSLPDRILTAIISAVEFENDRCRKLRDRDIGRAVESEEDEDNGSDDEDFDFDGGGGKRGIGKTLLDLIDEEDDDDDEFEGCEEGDVIHELERADPYHQLDLRRTVADYLAANASSTAARQDLAGRHLAGRLEAAVTDVRSNP